MKKLTIILLTFLCINGMAQKKKETPQEPVSVSYCLPEISFQVEVNTECIRQIPGPYHFYAERKLGVTPRVTKEKEIWKITGIRLIPQFVPDKKAVYTLTTNADYRAVTVSLSPEGFLAGISATPEVEKISLPEIDYTASEITGQQEIDISRFRAYSPLKEVLDTNYTHQEIDGVMKKIWDPIIRYEIKNEQDNINEIVKAIFQIRSKRASLLSSDEELPDGKALEVMMKEFDRMEQEYLSLFFGREEVKKERYTFRFTPEKTGESVPLFRFSESEGIVDKKDVTAVLYSVVVENAVVPASVSRAADQQSDASLYYRIPAMADIRLMRLNDEIQRVRMVVPQLGIITSFPLDVISGEKLSLLFYPQYGSLKSIHY